jgi:hypothetical protein
VQVWGPTLNRMEKKKGFKEQKSKVLRIEKRSKVKEEK